MEAFFANLPYVLLVLLCPLMMLFMGHGHGHGGQDHADHAHHGSGTPPDPAPPMTAKDEITTRPAP